MKSQNCTNNNNKITSSSDDNDDDDIGGSDSSTSKFARLFQSTYFIRAKCSRLYFYNNHHQNHQIHSHMIQIEFSDEERKKSNNSNEIPTKNSRKKLQIHSHCTNTDTSQQNIDRCVAICWTRNWAIFFSFFDFVIQHSQFFFFFFSLHFTNLSTLFILFSVFFLCSFQIHQYYTTLT